MAKTLSEALRDIAVPDASDRRQALVDELVAEDPAPATEEAASPDRRRWRIPGLVAVLAVAALAASEPGRAAVDSAAGVIGIGDGPAVPEGPHETAADCPAVAALYEQHSMQTDFFIPACPSLAEARREVNYDPASEAHLVAPCEEALENGSNAACEALLRRVEEGPIAP